MKKAALVSLLVALAAGVWWGLSSWGSTETSDPISEPAKKTDAPPDLRGTVRDSKGNPVGAATVVAASAERERNVETDDTGTFAFEDLPPATYRVDLRADGFATPGPRPLREVPVELRERSQRAEPKTLDLTVRRPAVLEGRVVAAGDPVEGARLSLYYLFAEGYRGGLDPFTLSNEGNTGADGTFRLEDVAPGRLRLIAESTEFPSRRTRELLVEPGTTRGDLVIDLDPRGVLAGKVVGSEGSPVAARLVVSGAPLSSPREAEADEDGNYRISGLPSGTYRLSARAPGHRVGTLDDIEIRGDGATRRAVRLVAGDGLFGRVIGPERQPVSGVYVRLQRDGSTEWRRTDRSGRFQWKKAPGGNWSARVFSPRHASPRTASARVGEPTVLQLRSGGYLRGRIVDVSGDPVAGARLGVAAMVIDGPRPYGPRAVGVETVDDETGTFRFGPLRPGQYSLEAQRSGYAAAKSSQRTVRTGETTDEVELVLGRGGTVAGTIRSKASGDPIEGARISAFDMTSPFDPKTDQTDAQGRFTLERVPSGRRSLRVRHDEYLTRIVSGLDVPEGGTVERSIALQADGRGKQFGFQGIGASLRRTDEGVEIRRLIPDGGAEKNGLQRGDVIRAVDREPVEDMPLSRVVKRIRGPGGEPVELTLERDGRGTFDVEVTRDRVVVEGRGEN